MKPIQAAGHNLHTIDQVAKELELSHQAVLDHILSGALNSWRVADGSLRVEEVEWQRFARAL